MDLRKFFEDMGKSKLRKAQDAQTKAFKAVDAANTELQLNPKDQKAIDAYEKAKKDALDAKNALDKVVVDKKAADAKAVADKKDKEAKADKSSDLPAAYLKKQREFKTFMAEKRRKAKMQFANQDNLNRWNVKPVKPAKPLSEKEMAEKRKINKEKHEEFMAERLKEAEFTFKDQDYPNQFGIAPKQAPNLTK